MCDKVVNSYPSTIKFVPECIMTKEICGTVVSDDPFSVVYCPDKYIIQKMYDEAVDDSIATLKLIPDWFVTSKMTKKLFTALYADENIRYFNEGDVSWCRI